MKRIVYIVAAFMMMLGIAGAQTQPTLPTGSVLFSSNIFESPDGLLWSGKAGKYVCIGSKSDYNALIKAGYTKTQVDSIAVEVRKRSTHTGTQAISTIDGLQAALDSKEDKTNKATSLLSPDNIKYPTTKAVADAIAAIPTPNYPVTSVNGKTGAVVINKTDVGLSNVDNTSDANKPISTATQTALDGKINTSEKGSSNGVATLDINSKVPLSQIPDALVGSVNYRGNWNASTNTPNLPTTPTAVTKGHYYIVSVAGTFNGLDYSSGDWIISNGIEWGKVDNTNKVVSVNGKQGVVVIGVSDIAGLQGFLDGKANSNGSNATGTWPINVSGNAQTATSALMADIANQAHDASNSSHWSSLPRTAGNITNPTGGIITLNATGDNAGHTTLPQLGSALGIDNKANIDGNNATGTWPVSITGSANRWGNQLYDGNYFVSSPDWGLLKNSVTGAWQPAQPSDMADFVKLGASGIWPISVSGTANRANGLGTYSFVSNETAPDFDFAFVRNGTQEFKLISKDNFKTSLGIGDYALKDGSNASGTWPISITGGSDRAGRLIGYDNSNAIYVGWNGTKATYKVDGSDFGGNWPIDIAGSATSWKGQQYENVENGLINSYIMALGAGNSWKPTSLGVVRQWMGIPSGGETLPSVVARDNLLPRGDVGAIRFTSSDSNPWGIKHNEGTYGGLNFVKYGQQDGALFLSDGLNVGIGTLTPTAKLDVNGSAVFSNNIYTGGTVNASYIDVTTGNSTQWNEAYTNHLEKDGLYSADNLDAAQLGRRYVIPGMVGIPSSSSQYGELVTTKVSSWVYQTFKDTDGDIWSRRNINAGGWQTWAKHWTERHISQTNINNWNQAYSWGNHAGLYRPISYVPSWSEVTGKPDVVTTNTVQSITAQKTFTQPVKGVDALADEDLVTKRQVPALAAQGSGLVRTVYNNNDQFDFSASHSDNVFRSTVTGSTIQYTVPAGTFTINGSGSIRVKLLGGGGTSSGTNAPRRVIMRFSQSGRVWNVPVVLTNSASSITDFLFSADVNVLVTNPYTNGGARPYYAGMKVKSNVIGTGTGINGTQINSGYVHRNSSLSSNYIDYTQSFSIEFVSDITGSASQWTFILETVTIDISSNN